jgi:hypothetical protein
MVENAERSIKKPEDDWATDGGGIATPLSVGPELSTGIETIAASDRVSTLQHALRPRLIYFRTSACFSL